ncbi:MAG: hypothetical protein COA84_12620 [Robiginitomaculum sp.]|nr:MAG: hypothetical protein COA84_12620 [Robiginitomaculum sp.]
MILRRVIKHFRHQEWTAIFLDFVIVVVGVIVGLQVSNWNDVRIAKLRMAQQLAVVAEEMTENGDRLQHYIEFLDGIITDMVKFRGVFAGKVDVSNDELNRLLWRALPVPTLLVKREALDNLLTSEQFTGPQVRALRQSFGQWDFKVADLIRTNHDALVYRDDFIHNTYSETIAFSSIEKAMPDFGLEMPPSPFQNEIATVISDLRLENIVTVRLTMSKESLKNAQDILAQTRDLIQLIKETSL